MNTVCISNITAVLPQSQLAIAVTVLIAETSNQVQKCGTASVKQKESKMATRDLELLS